MKQYTYDIGEELRTKKNNVHSGGGVPTLSGRAGGCAMADACAAETGLMPYPALAVLSVNGKSEVAPRDSVAPALSPALLNYVTVYRIGVMSNQKQTYWH